MIKQYVNGKSVGTVYATTTSADFTAVQPILAGRSEHYTKSASGGTALVVSNLNSKGFSVGKKDIDGNRLSAFVSLPHAKVTATDDNIRSSVLGVFDVGYDTTAKCEYVTMFRNSSKG